jgi:membrane protease YdiL (CAAX protease family)
MPDNENAPPESVSFPVSSVPVPSEATPNALRKIFYGPNGLRAGWRLFLYILLIAIFSVTTRWIRHHFFPAPPHPASAPLEPVRESITRALGFFFCAFAAWIMSKIEGEKWGHYGLPLRRAFGFDFWFGCLWGMVGVSLVMGALWAAGAYRIEGLALAGGAIGKYAVLWGILFLIVGLLEEYSLRGYTQYTLASGIGFWPAALVFSALFLLGHLGNPGENWMGLSDVFIIGMFLCFTLWRTGFLWFAVGMHAAWDWGLTYLYSVPNSGTIASGHLLNVRTQGPAWLTGGSAGPEGSVFNLIFDLLCFAVFAMIYKQRRWVGMNDRRRANERRIPPATLIDSSALDC